MLWAARALGWESCGPGFGGAGAWTSPAAPRGQARGGGRAGGTAEGPGAGHSAETRRHDIVSQCPGRESGPGTHRRAGLTRRSSAPRTAATSRPPARPRSGAPGAAAAGSPATATPRGPRRCRPRSWSARPPAPGRSLRGGGAASAGGGGVGDPHQGTLALDLAPTRGSKGSRSFLKYCFRRVCARARVCPLILAGGGALPARGQDSVPAHRHHFPGLSVPQEPGSLLPWSLPAPRPTAWEALWVPPALPRRPIWAPPPQTGAL